MGETDLKARALAALEEQRATETDAFCEMQRTSANEALGNLQGLLARVLDVRPEMSHAHVYRIVEDPLHPAAGIVVDGLLLVAHYGFVRAATGGTGWHGYTLYLSHLCQRMGCLNLVYDHRIESLSELGAALEVEDRQASPCNSCWTEENEAIDD